MPYWEEKSYPSELVPPDEQGWKTVKGRKETNAPVEDADHDEGGETKVDKRDSPCSR